MFDKFIDVAQIMRNIKKESETSVNMESDSSKQNDDFYHKEWDWRKKDILGHRGQIEFHKNIGMKVPQFTSFNRFTRKILRIASKVINKAAFIITRDQNIVNSHVLLSIDRLREGVELLLSKTHNIESVLNSKMEQNNSKIEENIKGMLQGYVTKDQIEENIKGMLQGYVTKDQIEENIKGMLQGYVTKDQIEENIKGMLQDYATKDQIETNIKDMLQGYVTEHKALEIFGSESVRVIDRLENTRCKNHEECNLSLQEELDYVKNENKTLTKVIDDLQGHYLILETKYDELINKLNSNNEDRKKAISRINQKINRFPRYNIKNVTNEEIKHYTANIQFQQMYRDFEDRHRGSESIIKSRFNAYIEFLKQDEFNSLNKCLDIGCGRGEWLELLQENGYDCLGIDMNREFVDMCTAKGLNVILEDALSYIKSVEDNKYDIISGFHIIEHIEYNDLNFLISELNRVLKPGGIIIFETPNPQNVTVGSCNFYMDPTHIRPVPQERIKFQLEHFGFYNIEYLFWQEDRLENSKVIRDSIINSNLDSNIKQLLFTSNTWFNAPGDFGIIGRKA